MTKFKKPLHILKDLWQDGVKQQKKKFINSRDMAANPQSVGLGCIHHVIVSQCMLALATMRLTHLWLTHRSYSQSGGCK